MIRSKFKWQSLLRRGVERFNSVSDPEQDYRRQLLAESRKGKVVAKEELEREYHVRTYSAAERAKLYCKAIRRPLDAVKVGKTDDALAVGKRSAECELVSRRNLFSSSCRQETNQATGQDLRA